VSIFKDCDIRGIYGPELNEDTAWRLGRAVGARLLGGIVAVGGDLRPSTSPLKEALMLGLQQSGAHVLDLGILPTPVFYYGQKLLGATGGVMVTASHNPAQYNGFKLIFGDLAVTPEELQTLARAMAVGDFPSGPGSAQVEAVLPAYLGFLEHTFAGLKPHHVVIDAGNGSMWSVAPTALCAAGQMVDELYCTPDGTFPNRDPNPAVPAHLTALQECVLETRAEIGVAYDGDGDRVIFVDELGRIQPADRMLVLLAREVLAHHPGGSVVYDQKSSLVVSEGVLAAGGQPLIEKSGHAFIKRRLLTSGAVLGGEISGHYFFGELGGDDALYATLFLLRVLDSLGQTLAQAMGAVPSYPITPDLRFPCTRELAQRILQQLLAAFHDYPVSQLDGVRIAFPHGWALARISVTEPLITLRFEAHSDQELANIEHQTRSASPLLDELFAANGC
jgi:phosphomannomutase / phosphoglucomutase